MKPVMNGSSGHDLERGNHSAAVRLWNSLKSGAKRLVNIALTGSDARQNGGVPHHLRTGRSVAIQGLKVPIVPRRGPEDLKTAKLRNH